MSKKRGSKKEKKKTISKAKKKRDCFTIMPFGGYFDKYYDGIYRPAIERAGLNSTRADDLYRPSTIINDIWALTKKAVIILADLTGKYPNVLYELGLAHAIAKPAVLVAEALEDIPFDLRHLRIVLYNKNNHDWGEILKKEIENSIKEVLDSPMEAVLPTFLQLKESNKSKAVTRSEKQILELQQDLDLLKKEIRNIPRSSERYTVSTVPQTGFATVQSSAWNGGHQGVIAGNDWAYSALPSGQTSVNVSTCQECGKFYSPSIGDTTLLCPDCMDRKIT